MGPQTLSGRFYLPSPYSYYSQCLEQTQPGDCGGPGGEGEDQSPAGDDVTNHLTQRALHGDPIADQVVISLIS